MKANRFNLPNGHRIDYTLRQSRRSRSITLRIYADGGLRVAAPVSASKRTIESYIAAKADWIVQSQSRYAAKQSATPIVSYQPNSLHYYLGEQYSLVWDMSLSSDVVCSETTLQLRCNDEQQAQQLLMNWYRQQAHDLFLQRLTYWSELAPWVECVPPLRIRAMSSRWGSCSALGRICLNTHLIKAPLAVIDEVVVHELCHLKEMNHSARFYYLVESLLPDWRVPRQWLKQHSAAMTADHALWA